MKQFNSVFLINFFLCFSIFSYSQSRWTCYPNNDSIKFASGILGMFNYHNSTWLINTEGMYTYSGSTWTCLNHSKDHLKKNISKYYFDKTQNLWVGSDGPIVDNPLVVGDNPDEGGMSMYDGKTWTLWTKKELGIDASITTHIYESSNGDIWVAMADPDKSIPGGIGSPLGLLGSAIVNGIKSANRKAELLQFNQGKWMTHVKDLPCSDCRFVNGIYETADKKIWFWTYDGHLFHFENGNFIEVDKRADVDFKTGISPAFYDSKKDLMLAQQGKIFMYRNGKWQTFDKKNGIPKLAIILSIWEINQGSLIMISTAGIFKFDGNDKWDEVSKFRSPGAFKIARVAAIPDHEGNIWVIHNGDLGVYDSSHLISKLDDKDLKILFLDRENRAWASDGKGIYLKEKGTWTYKDKINHVKGFMEDRDSTLWILTENDGVISYKDGKRESYTEQNGLLSSKIINMYITQNNSLWVLTDKGICKFNRN